MRVPSLVRLTIVCLTAVAVAASVLSGCGPQAPPPTEAEPSAAAPTATLAPTTAATDVDTFTIAVDTEPRLLDPLVDDTVTFHQVQRLVYEPLITLEADSGEPKAFLAKSWEISEDGKEYTFDLEEGIKFHDGTLFNADAVKYSIERVKGVNVFAAPLIQSIESVEVVDDSTVKLHLSAPDGSLLHALNWVFMVSPTAFRAQEKEGDWAKEWAAENMVGTGPYLFEKWDRGSQLVFTRYDDYWRGWSGKHFQTFVAKYVPERATQRLLLEQGDIDIAFQLTEDDLKELEANPDTYVFKYAALKAGHIAFNTSKGLSADPKIRLALAHVFPSDDYITVLQGIGTQASGPYPEPLIGEFATELPGYKYDVDEAKALLADAGYPNGGIELELVYYTGWKWEELAATLLQDSAKQINVDIKLVGSEWPPMYERLLKPDTAPDIYVFGSAAWVPDPSAYFGPNFSCAARGEAGYNWMHYCNEELDSLVDTARGTVDPTERLKLYQEATQTLAEDCPWFSTHVELAVYGVRNWVKGLYSNPVWAGENILDYYSVYKE